MKRLFFCLVWGVLLGPLRGFCAADPPLCLFSNYTTLDGMVHDRIADIYTDSRGFVWLCTWYGVSCFDGYTFRNFSTMPVDSSPLSHHRFVSVSEDTNGHLWFMTYNLHIYRFNRFTEQFEDVAQLIEGIDPKHYRTTGCLHDRSGGTWISIAGVGAVRFVDTPDAAPVQVDAVFDELVLGGAVCTMYVDDRDNAWIAASDGQLNFVASGALGHRARTVCETDEPIFGFAANDTGVYGIAPHAVVRTALHGGEAVAIPASGAPLTAIAADSIGGSVYAGNAAGELFRVEGDRLVRLSPAGRRPKRIRALNSDSHGIVWITTADAGITRYNPASNDYKHFEQQPYNVSYNTDTLTCFAEKQGRLWIKMNEYGFGYYDRESDEVRPFYNDPARRDCRMTNAVACFVVQDNVLWLSTYHERGLQKAVLLEQPADIFTLDFEKQFGLVGEVRALMSDRQGDLWVSTLHCVSRFDPETERFANYPLYDDTHAAIFSEATAVSLPNGKVLFGSGRNIYRFDPEKMRALRVNYNLRFTGLEVRNRAIVPGEWSPLAESISEASEIVLPYDFSNMRIEFAALNQAVQHMVGYLYKLEGYDRDWAFAGTSNSAFYSGLPAGNYRFRVKTSTDSSDAGGEEIAVDVQVLPPPWFTWWAKSLYVLVLLGICFVVYRVVSTMIRIRREVSVEQNMTDLKLRFFTNISHELRTPLTLILGGIEDVIKHDRLSSRGNISLSLAHRNAKRMLSLVNQLLDFRKIVKNKMELKISRVNLVPLVEDALDDFREMASERKIDLLFTVSSRSILVWVDVERIESVVYNLLSNALKFTPERGRIEVILSFHEEEGCAKIVVRDTGIGIPKEKQEHIFERFAQAFHAVDPEMKGSGIGLSLCRDIVELHHGEISVESRPGRGAAFTVKLKLGNAHFGMEQIDFAAANGSADYMVSDYTSMGSQHRTDVQPPSDAQKILLVEDNRELRIFIYNSLIETYRVIEADDGVDALAKIHAEMPDIVVTDLMMPRMDGIELIDKVRHDFTVSHIPIIMLTARHSPDDRVKAMEYGADGYITKPFSIELLLARIDNLLNQRRMLFEKYSTQSARNKVEELSVEGMVVTDRDEEFMKEVMTWLSEHIENSDLTIDQLAGHLGLGRTTMYNKLKSLTGKSPIELIKEFRITRAQLLLRTGQFSVSEVAYKVGFSDPGYFSRCFREICHMSPAEYLKTHDLKQKQ